MIINTYLVEPLSSFDIDRPIRRRLPSFFSSSFCLHRSTCVEISTPDRFNFFCRIRQHPHRRRGRSTWPFWTGPKAVYPRYESKRRFSHYQHYVGTGNASATRSDLGGRWKKGAKNDDPNEVQGRYCFSVVSPPTQTGTAAHLHPQIDAAKVRGSSGPSCGASNRASKKMGCERPKTGQNRQKCKMASRTQFLTDSDRTTTGLPHKIPKEFIHTPYRRLSSPAATQTHVQRGEGVLLQSRSAVETSFRDLQ